MAKEIQKDITSMIQPNKLQTPNQSCIAFTIVEFIVLDPLCPHTGNFCYLHFYTILNIGDYTPYCAKHKFSVFLLAIFCVQVAY